MRMLFVVGPTASGKTSFALRLADKVNGEIISADSMQIYKRMDIGTAKATIEERAHIPHHLIDICEPWEKFSVGEFQALAMKKAEEITARGHMPIVAGGTGLYIWSLLYPWSFSKSPENTVIREKWERFSREMGEEALHRELMRLDSAAAERLHKNDVRRVIRALEIIESTGTPMCIDEERQIQEGYRILGLNPDRERLYQRIETRVDQMIENGLIEEVSSLMQEGATLQWQSMQGLGYKQVFPYLMGDVSLQQMKEEIKLQTRHYAKRQMTWFKREKAIEWIVPENISEFLQNKTECL